jgi:predicted HD phosphohydrolase
VNLAELTELLSQLGSTPSEEAGITELEHALQCAAMLVPFDRELQVAGLVHDIGHRFGDDASHGSIGASLVAPLLGARVAALVEAHVPAKRYLVARGSYPVSPVSEASLALQGGPMSADEAFTFSQSPWFDDALRLRRADEAAKVPGRVVPGLDTWLPVLRSVALQSWVSAVQEWPAGSHIWGHYAERTPNGSVISRTENVSACHAGIRELVDG